MIAPKPCKWCESVWHSKNKCPLAPDKPSKLAYPRKGTNTPPKPQSASERPILAYKGSSERSQLIGYADKAFSLHIRTRGGDGSSNTCYTCSIRLPYDELQCGHFIARRYLNTRWHELNCWPQCNDCNVVKQGNLEVYERLLRHNYGDAAVDELQRLALSGGKITLLDIKDVVERYKGLAF